LGVGGVTSPLPRFSSTHYKQRVSSDEVIIDIVIVNSTRLKWSSLFPAINMNSITKHYLNMNGVPDVRETSPHPQPSGSILKLP
jgi:hypothetical protein